MNENIMVKSGIEFAKIMGRKELPSDIEKRVAECMRDKKIAIDCGKAIVTDKDNVGGIGGPMDISMDLKPFVEKYNVKNPGNEIPYEILEKSWLLVEVFKPYIISR